MLRTLLKSKIHRARVTDASLNYEGSITIPRALMVASGLVEYEQVYVWDVSNGKRLVTYAMEGQEEGRICMNGAAARLINIGDVIIIAAFGIYNSLHYRPRIVYVDKNNREKL